MAIVKAEIELCERQQSWNAAEVQASILQLRKEMEEKQKELEKKMEEKQKEMEEKQKEMEEKQKQLEKEMNEKQNLVEKKMEEKQKQLEEVRRVAEAQAGRIAGLEGQIVGHQGQLDQLKENTVPAGFIYTELPGHPAPQIIWPQFQWEDVSASLAGKFFRVVGGNSAPFGSPQGADWSRITTVGNGMAFDAQSITLPESGWSSYIFSGQNDGPGVGQRFYVEARENRPANVAVKLWKRGIRNR